MSRSPSAPLRWSLAFALLHLVLVAALSTNGFFWIFEAISTRVSGGSVSRNNVFDDVSKHYYLYARQFFEEGRVPYRDFVVEYPIVALPLFLLPYLVGGRLRYYGYAFALEMMAINLVIVVLVARWVAAREGPGHVPGRLGWYTLCIAAFGCMLIMRYDLAPALLTCAGVLLWSNGRVIPAGAVLGLGVLTKIFPGVVAGPAVLATQPRRRGVAGAVALVLTVLLGLGVWHLLSAGQAIASFRYHLDRGLEIGSVYSGILGLAAYVSGSPLQVEYLHSSMELTGAWANRVAVLVMPIHATTLLLVLVRYRRSTPADLPWSAAAILLAYILTGKVLSPQYLIWPLPLMAVLEGPGAWTARWLYLACCLATLAVYPTLFIGVVNMEILPLIVLNVRNALLVALFAWLLRGPAGLAGSTE